MASNDVTKNAFLSYIIKMIKYWQSQEQLSEKEKLEGVAYSILVAIDGEAPDVGPYSLCPLLEDENWGADISGNLHDLFYKAIEQAELIMSEQTKK